MSDGVAAELRRIVGVPLPLSFGAEGKATGRRRLRHPTNGQPRPQLTLADSPLRRKCLSVKSIEISMP